MSASQLALISKEQGGFKVRTNEKLGHSKEWKEQYTALRKSLLNTVIDIDEARRMGVLEGVSTKVHDQDKMDFLRAALGREAIAEHSNDELQTAYDTALEEWNNSEEVKEARKAEQEALALTTGQSTFQKEKEKETRNVVQKESTPFLPLSPRSGAVLSPKHSEQYSPFIPEELKRELGEIEALRGTTYRRTDLSKSIHTVQEVPCMQ